MWRCLAIILALTWSGSAKAEMPSHDALRAKAIKHVLEILADRIDPTAPGGTWTVFGDAVYLADPRPRVIICERTISVVFGGHAVLEVFRLPTNSPTWADIPDAYWDTPESGRVFGYMCGVLAAELAVMDGSMNRSDIKPIPF
jgi:hypothetical protein